MIKKSYKAETTPSESVQSRISPWLIRIIYPIGRFVVFPFYWGNIKVIGQENIPKDDPVILAPTHRSRWDALVIPYATGRHVSGRDLHYMVSIDEMHGLQGWFIRRLGGFAVNPQQPGISSFRHSVDLLTQGKMLAIFPEGNIFREQSIQPLKTGLARIGIQAASQEVSKNTKILPISVRYSDTYPTFGTHVEVKIGKAIPVIDYCKGSSKKNAERLTADLQASLRELAEEVETAEDYAPWQAAEMS